MLWGEMSMGTQTIDRGQHFRNLTKEPQMKVVLKVVAVLFVAMALFLVYAVIAALTAEEGARIGVCVIYAAVAGVLGFLAVKFWNWRAGGAPRPA
jgi:sterol desaturase/sphingolipid hydroxylase (fatty acid hydroxylase superfamily)